jgi:hypothetical protein
VKVLPTLSARPALVVALGVVVGAAIGDTVRRRRAVPGLGRIARNDGYTYRYATRGPGTGLRPARLPAQR